jgi:hypothetical protein
MLRALCLALTMVLAVQELASADAPPDLGANAALKYWQGFASLPSLTDAEQRKLGECLTMPLDAQARATVDKARYALEMMRRGAALPQCDWGISYEEGVGTLLPYAQAARLTANLACLRARLRFEEGQATAAVDDIIAAMTLGRRVSVHGIDMTVLTSYAIDQHMGEVLARYLPKLDPQTLRTVQNRLESLPRIESLADALKVEEHFALDWLVGVIKQAKDKESLQNLLGKLAGSPEKGRALFNQFGGNADALLKFAEETRQCYARSAKNSALPLEQFAKAWDSEAKEQANNPVYHWIFPALHKVRLAQLRADIRHALLLAAVAVQLDGPEALKNHPDPVVGGRFDYRGFEGGFELRSKWKLEDELRLGWKLDGQLAKPLTITVGVRGN